MRAAFACLQRRIQNESGWSLVELLTAMSIFTFVMVGILGLLDTSAQTTPKDTERAHAIREAQVGLDRMVRELRQAHTYDQVDSRQIQVVVRRGRDNPATPASEAVDKTVAYTCTTGKCERKEASTSGQISSATPETVIARVLNTGSNLPTDRAIFDQSGNENTFSPTYVRVHIEVPAKGTRANGYPYAIALEDGFYARNINPGR